MVSLLVSSLHGGSTPALVTPEASPVMVRRVFTTGASPTQNRGLYMKFSCQDQPLGRIIIKVREDAGRVGWVFESLVTGRDGFGYRGSRVYATCPQEWLLLGDLLYATPRPPTPPATDWDPFTQVTPPTNLHIHSNDINLHQLKLHHGYVGVPQTQLIVNQGCQAGAVVAVASDFDLESLSWKLGPQVKICLSDAPMRFGEVVGEVTEGLDVAHKISQLGRKASEPMERITITDCGVL